MTAKQHVLRLLRMMPEEATFAHIVRWVDLVDFVGVSPEPDQVDADLESDLAAFFAREKRKKAKPDRLKSLDIFGNQSIRAKCIDIVQRLPDEVASGEILYRLVVVKKIAESLADGDKGAMDHDEFFEQVEKEDEDEEKSEAHLARPRPKRPAPDQRLHRRGRSSNGIQVRGKP